MRRSNSTKRLKLCLVSFLLALVFTTECTLAGEVSNSAVEDPGLSEQINTPPSHALDFQSFADKIGRHDIILTHNLSLLSDHQKTEQRIKDISISTEEFTTKSKSSLKASGRKTGDLLEIKKQVQERQMELDKVKTLVTSDISKLSAWKLDWLHLDDTLQEWQRRYEQDSRLSFTQESDLADLHQTIYSGLKEINGKLHQLTNLISRIRGVDESLFELGYKADTTIKKNLLAGPQQTSPRILSVEFFQQFNMQFWKDLSSSFGSSVQIQLLNLDSPKNHLLLLIVAAALVLGAYLLRSLTSGDPESIQVFQQRPFAAAYFLITHGYWIYLVLSNSANPGLHNLILFLQLIAISRLVDFFIAESRNQSFLKGLISFLAVLLFLQLFSPHSGLIRLAVFFATTAGIAYCLYHGYQTHKSGKKGIYFYFPLAIAVSLLPVFGMVGYGYDELAIQFFVLTAKSLIHGIDTWMLFLLLSCLLGAGITSLPIKTARENSRAIVTHLQPILFIICSTLFFVFTLTSWYIFPSHAAAFSAIFSSEWVLGKWSFQPALIIQIVLTVYATFLVIRASRGLLQQTVLPHYDIETGVQFSIIRLVNYFFIFVGFMILLYILGIELTKLTIFGSALGIGVGFGLQAIVNNFASGLMLLFERPVKVGDMVQIGTDIGTVQHLGLRSTVIKTFNNAEIVIPNSDLITGQVTNWTLSDKQVRLDIPVGVAYGSDIEQVINILRECGENNPQVLSQPSPQPLFIRFNESSLDFELRVWLRDYIDRINVLSELNIDIENEFAINGIKIPFPQRDLHLVSDETRPGPGKPMDG